MALPWCLTLSLKTHFIRPLGLKLWVLLHYCTTGCLFNFLLPPIITVVRINAEGRSAEIIPWVDNHSALPSFPPFRGETAQSCCSCFIKQHITSDSFPVPLSDYSDLVTSSPIILHSLENLHPQSYEVP